MTSNPLASEINALPERMRKYVHDLETDCDPAGEKARIICLEENVAGLSAEIERLTRERDEAIADRDHSDALCSRFITERDRLRAALEKIAEWTDAVAYRGLIDRPGYVLLELHKVAKQALGAFPAPETEK